jgi:hypothetical protein
MFTPQFDMTIELGKMGVMVSHSNASPTRRVLGIVG